jgi:ParB/RepB/Spo0J family partition protein
MTRAQLGALHFGRDRDWLQLWRAAPRWSGRAATRGWHALAGVRVAGDRPASGVGPEAEEGQMATTAPEIGRRVALDRIRVPENVRTLDDAHVQALAGSIKLQGILVPVVVRDDGENGFELVAGFHRIAAAQSLGLAEVPVVVRDAQSEDADRAIENITRKQLNPYEEAKAVRAMLDRGLTEDGAAQALGWPKTRVTARVKVLELPERAQQLIGDGVIALSAVDQLRAIGGVAPELLDAVIAYLDDGNAWAAERLAREPGWVLDAALSHAGDRKVFAAYLHAASSHEIAELRLGKKTEQIYADAEKLHRQLDRYAYGPPQVRFSDEDVDRARAAGVLSSSSAAGRSSWTARCIASWSRARSSARTTSSRPRPRPPPRRRRPRAPAPRRRTRSRWPSASATRSCAS